ncbi:MAG TPA: EamA family transporter [Steroidobacteraceae bacterium]|nr:EamA family transporter [Steroidobacteraceae bacterium]
MASIATCALIWGTTWYAITLQLGSVDPIVSVVYRFGLAAALLFAWCAITRAPVALTPRQHAASFGVGLCTFTVDYACVYLAEARVTSAVVAVAFGATAFINLIVFRWLFGQRSPASAWVAAGLGVLGVALLSWEELASAHLDRRVITGLAFSLVAVLTAVLGNACARRAEQEAAPLAASTAWAMGYGATLLSIFVLLSGRRWSFDARATYVLSLLYLALLGSGVAFLLYFGVARRRGYTLAAYVTALTPLIAMLMSSLFEAKSWHALALVGVAFVILGQWLLLRTRTDTKAPLNVHGPAEERAR